jgi:hypothetical protein
VYAFVCTDGNWTGDPERYFRYYHTSDIICRIPNRKLWKNVGRVSLAGGGHRVEFSGMRISPERFVMKHYAFRTPAQTKEKLRIRLERRCREEHAMGWGVHYDQPFPPDFCWDVKRDGLLEWPNLELALP